MTDISEYLPAVPAVPTTPTAAELVQQIRDRGARIYRMRVPPQVFCLTGNPEVAAWLRKLGGRPFTPPGMGIDSDGSYARARGVREWDVYIHTIPVDDDKTIWEAAA